MEVVYKEIDGYPGYRVGDDGSIQSHWRSSRWGRVFTKDWHPMKPSVKKDRTPGRAYMYLNLVKDGKARTFRVHRLVLTAFVGPCPEGMETRHINGNPMDNRLENLAWGTPEQNREDNHRLKTYQKGGKHSQAKLTEEQVVEIRRLYATGKLLQREIADRFSISVSCISPIVNKKTWTHVV